MNPYILIAALATPCTKAAPIAAGTPAPCTGVLWTIPETRNALKCKKVDLVKASAELAFCERTKKAETAALLTRAISAESLLRAAPQPSPSWILPTVATGTAFVGVVVGFLLSKVSL